MTHEPGTQSEQASTGPVAQCRCGYALWAEQRCPECGRSFAEATEPAPVFQRWLLSLISLVLAVVPAPSFMCACGHFDPFAFLCTGPAFVLAWWPFLFDRELRFVPRAFKLIVVVVVTMLLLKNVCDVLWLGHNPLFP